MITKKSKKADLERKRSMFFQIGFIMAIGAVLVAFEWESAKDTENYVAVSEELIELDLPPIVTLEDPKPEIAPPPQIAIEELIIVDDSEDIVEEFDINSESTEETEVPYETLEEDNSDSDPIPFAFLADKPEFPGGNDKLLSYLGKSVNYPIIAQENGIQGTVYISFIIDEEGTVTNVAVARGVDPSLDNEALRVVSQMPNWKPGKQGTKEVKVSYSVPIRFILQ